MCVVLALIFILACLLSVFSASSKFASEFNVFYWPHVLIVFLSFAFQSTLARHFGIGTECKNHHTYSALSKCNGNGSIRLTATLVTNRANHQVDDPLKSEIVASEAALQQRHQEDVINCLKNKCPSHHHKYRHRCISVSSQATLLTTVSKNDTVTLATSQSQVEQSNGKHQSTLGTIAEKLRRGTRKVLLFTTTTSTSPTHAATNGKDTKLQKDNSVDSAHTNTISNSSLQEVDAEEFDSAELAKYMGEINEEIR